MKKLFVAVLALGALASCQKEDVPATEEAKNKTIEINILNITEDTRSIEQPTVGGDTAQGTEALCAEFSELNVLFAKADGTIMFEFPLYTTQDGIGDDHKDGEEVSGENNLGGSWTEGDEITVDDTDVLNNGTRRWHNVPSYITQIAVVRYEENDVDITLGETKLAKVKAAAENQALNIERPVTTMVLYGTDTLEDTGETHRVGDSVFHVWKADVTVAPAFARFEVRSIYCTDLGDANMDVYEGTTDLNPTTYGFDELLLKSLTLTYNGSETYTAPGFGSKRLLGSYISTASETYDEITNPSTARTEDDSKYLPTTTNGAWSWNLTPGTFTSLVLDIDAYAYDYDIDLGGEGARNFPLTVVGLATSRDAEGNVTGEDNQFVAGNIYYIDLVFTESNISENESICVDVEVTINPWNVVERYPIYGKN